MRTTSLGQKKYNTKTYNKPDYMNPNNPNQKAFGKAPKYPTIISQARKAVTPLSQRIGPDSMHSPGHYNDGGYRDVDMRPAGEYTPAALPGPSDSSGNVIDVTQHTLMQLSQSSAFQSLLQRGPTSPVCNRAVYSTFVLSLRTSRFQSKLNLSHIRTCLLSFVSPPVYRLRQVHLTFKRCSRKQALRLPAHRHSCLHNHP